MRRLLLRDTTALGVGTILSGIAAYAYIALGTRAYGASGFAPISVLWTFWAMSAAVITFPVQHWVIRTIEADSGEGRVRSAIRSLTWATTICSVLTGLLSWIWRDTLFLSDGIYFPALVAMIPFGSMAVGLSRGGLAARGKFAKAGAAIAGENLIRVLLGMLIVGLGLDIEIFAGALIGGFFISVAWPSALSYEDSTSDYTSISPLAFLGGVAGGTLIRQVVLTGGPIALAVIGGAPAEITALFSALAIFRAPYMISTGLAVRFTGSLTRLVLDGSSSQIQRIYWGTMATAVVAAGSAAILGITAGPAILVVVFGETVELQAALVAVVAAGSALAVVGLFYILVLVASARVRLITTSWLIAALVWVLWIAVGPGTPVWRVTSAFAVAETVALGAMLFGTRKGV